MPALEPGAAGRCTPHAGRGLVRALYACVQSSEKAIIRRSRTGFVWKDGASGSRNTPEHAGHEQIVSREHTLSKMGTGEACAQIS